MEIKYYSKHVYGKPLNYIVDTPEQQRISQGLMALTGRVSMTKSDMAAMKLFGFTFTEVLGPK